MDLAEKVCIGVIGFTVSAFSGCIVQLVSYESGAKAIKLEALQSKVACFKPDGPKLEPKFTFDCAPIAQKKEP